LKIIEQSFPVSAFGHDASTKIDSINQTISDPEAFRSELIVALPILLEQVDGDMAALTALLRVTEPWCGAWNTTESLLKEKGWFRAEP
jgi:hypothetical protein